MYQYSELALFILVSFFVTMPAYQMHQAPVSTLFLCLPVHDVLI